MLIAPTELISDSEHNPLWGCKCMQELLRMDVGKMKHLSATQLWVQGATMSYIVEVQRVPRAEETSDILTHPGWEPRRRAWILHDSVAVMGNPSRQTGSFGRCGVA